MPLQLTNKTNSRPSSADILGQLKNHFPKIKAVSLQQKAITEDIQCTWETQLKFIKIQKRKDYKKIRFTKSFSFLEIKESKASI